ncbi:hypothetical protein VTH06DRAFT_4665 [Thermothelomyces fergusii]
MWIISVLYFLFTAGLIIMLMLQCHPIGVQWTEPEGRCWDFSITTGTAVAHGACSAVLDWYLALYPTIVLCQLQMAWKKKLALSSALGFGYC